MQHRLKTKKVAPRSWVHGGASGNFPKNTIAGFEFAVRDGAQGLEIDVHVTSDDVVVLLHHPRLEYSGTNGKGLVKDQPYHGVIDGLWTKQLPPQRIPTFGQAVDFMLEHPDVIINVDVKMDNEPERLFSLMNRIFAEKPESRLQREVALYWDCGIPYSSTQLKSICRTRKFLTLDFLRNLQTNGSGNIVNVSVCITQHYSHQVEKSSSIDVITKAKI